MLRRLGMGGGKKKLLRNDWYTKLFQTHSLGFEIFFSKMFFESHSNMFLYIHLQIPHQQEDSSFNLTSSIYPPLRPCINPHIILCKYPTSLSSNILFLFLASTKATHWEITPSHFKQ